MIYLLSREDHVGYDEFDAKVVLANSEKQARELANEYTGDEGAIWTDSKLVSCEPIYSDQTPRVILGSFCAG